MYIVLARKYRPQNFSGLIGQRTIVQGLQDAIKGGRIPHAFLFSGPRGIGKTSVARILAKSLNCEKGPLPEPCGECEFCKEVSSGMSLDFLEIDGASNRGIDEIKNLRENIALRPAKSRFKIYLIDEVHMLTTEAFNALLKTLEEPPSYAKFIFATTSPEKIPQTILSRCQKYEFKPLNIKEITEQISLILKKEGYTIEPRALEKIILTSSGSLRDVLGYIDQLIIFAKDKRITLDITEEVLGMIKSEAVWDMISLLIAGETNKSITLLHKFMEEGKDLVSFFNGISQNLRLLLFRNINLANEDFNIINNEQYLKQIPRIPSEQILKAIEITLEIKEKTRYEPLEIIYGEILVIKLSGILNITGKDIDRNKEKISEEKPAPFPVPDGPVTGIKDEQWKEILTETKKKKRTLEACLREAQQVKIENETFCLGFPDKMQFHSSVVQNKDNLAIIEKIVEKILGCHYNISCFFIAGEVTTSIKDKPSVKGIVNFFNGNIIETEE